MTINDAPAHGVGHFPFGRRKPDSGIGREGLGYPIDECTVPTTVVLPACRSATPAGPAGSTSRSKASPRG